MRMDLGQAFRSKKPRPKLGIVQLGDGLVIGKKPQGFEIVSL